MADKHKGSRALDGVKILAFEQVLSGPFATCLLADMGAEVIKIERPGVGDDALDQGSHTLDLLLLADRCPSGGRRLAADVEDRGARVVQLARERQLGIQAGNAHSVGTDPTFTGALLRSIRE